MFVLSPRTQFASVLTFMTVSAPVVPVAFAEIALAAAETAKRTSPSVVQVKADFGKCAASDLAYERNANPPRRLKAVAA
jgi:hypothetical protein